jgi:2',3'-cyclic-nucleotide 2'-phosphodiesterase
MRILLCGDLVGRVGREIVIREMPRLRRELLLDIVIANGENAAHGFGITDKICGELYEAGVDVITLGNHAWDKREIIPYIAGEPRLVRPINYPAGTPGSGVYAGALRDGRKVAVINAMARLFMDALDDPFAAVERELAACPLKLAADAIVIDLHGEATSEKQAMGYFVDGRATMLVGTHTHVPTADYRLLPGRTAFMSDVGMTGDFDSVIGMVKDEPLTRFLRKVPGSKFEAAGGPATMCGIAVETDDATGLARKVAAVRLGGGLEQARPAFWE